MDIIFICPNCPQEMVVDEEASGQDIQCPNCQQQLVIPQLGEPGVQRVDENDTENVASEPPPKATASAPAPAPSSSPAPTPPAPSVPEPSAAAAAEQLSPEAHSPRFKVPVHDTPTEVLVKEKHVHLVDPFGGAKGAGIWRIKCIRRAECIEIGKDHFDEIVSNFLAKIPPENLVSLEPLAYSTVEVGTQKLITDYGVMVVYKT